MTISVVVPVYNGADFIADCVHSLQRQTYAPREIIVVDDGSTDHTSEVVAGLGVTVVRLTQNQGAGAARDAGAKKASGDLVAFLDADCVAPADWLASILELFAASPDLGGVGGRYRHGAPVSVLAAMAKVEEEYAHAVFATAPDAASPPAGNSAFRRSVWETARSGAEVWLFRGTKSGEDTFVNQEIRAQAPVRFVHDLAVDHRPLSPKGYFRRHIHRGRSGAMQLGAASGGSLEAYGGVQLVAASAALVGAAALVPVSVIAPPAAVGVVALLAVHVGLSRRFFRFAADHGITLWHRTLMRPVLVARTASWAIGAAQIALQKVSLRAKTTANVVASIAHFWRPGRISKLFYFVTSRCNARCDFCYNLDNVIDWKRRLPHELSVEEVRKIAAKLGRLPYLNLSGGEPFVRRDLPQILEAFHQHAHTQWVTIPTNASLPKQTVALTQEILSRCPGLSLTIQISLDSMREEHDASRKIKGGFAALVQTMKGLARLRRFHPNLRIQIATAFDDFNVDRMEEMIAFCREHFDYDQQMFYLIRDNGAFITTSKNHLIDRYLNTIAANESFEWRGRRRTLRNTAVRALHGLAIADFLRLRRSGEYLRKCYATKKFVTLYDDGQISPCELRESDRLGNIRDHGYDFYALMNTDKTRDFHANEIVEKQCNCDWTCALPVNMLYDVKMIGRVGKALLKPSDATSA